MNLSNILRSGISIKTQQPGLAEDGPLSPSLEVLASTVQEMYPHSLINSSDEASKPISLIGAELAKIYTQRKVRVIFTDTGGSAIAPWQGMIVLDLEYIGSGQISSPATIAKVAHELTHLLQRSFNQPHYWPSGGLRPASGRRWIGDSTTYMEVIAYTVGFTVEHDLIAAQRFSSERSRDLLTEDENKLTRIRDHLATLTDPDPRNACRLVLKLFPENEIYRQNYELEERTPDGRIPPGSWHLWFRQLGFSRLAVDHVMILAARGHAEWIEVDQIT
jgi:hypothetical protein